MVDRELTTQIFKNLIEYRRYQIENNGQSGAPQDHAKQLPEGLLRIVAHFAVRLEEEKEFLNTSTESTSFFSDPSKYVKLRHEFYQITGETGKVDGLAFLQILNLSHAVRDWMLVRGGEETLQRKIEMGYPFDKDLPHKV